MRVEYTARVRAELRKHLVAGIAQFGPQVADRTFRRINSALNLTLAAQPYLGRFLPGRKVYRYVIAKTPFVVYYHVEAADDVITILAIFHGAQNRSEFERD